jgi:hypothetical protein
MCAPMTATLKQRLLDRMDTDFDEIEHLVEDDDPDTALCGVDQTDVPWEQGLPLCQACVAVSQGRMS